MKIKALVVNFQNLSYKFLLNHTIALNYTIKQTKPAFQLLNSYKQFQCQLSLPSECSALDMKPCCLANTDLRSDSSHGPVYPNLGNGIDRYRTGHPKEDQAFIIHPRYWNRLCGVLKGDKGEENNKDKPARIHLENVIVKSKVIGKYYPLIRDKKMA